MKEGKMTTKIIDINSHYYVKINYHENNPRRLYMLNEKKEDNTVCESFNRDSFLLKANKVVKISNQQELLIASY